MMNDLIRRQDAVDALQKEINKGIPPFDDVIGSIRCGVRLARNIIEDLPSTEPTRCQHCKYFTIVKNQIVEEVKSAEPVIRCKDCKHFYRDDIEEHTPYGFYNIYFHAFCDKHWDKEQGEYIDVNTDDFCAWAERRTDEGHDIQTGCD